MIYEGADAEFNPENTHEIEIIGFDEHSELTNEMVQTIVEGLIPSTHLAYCDQITCEPNDHFWKDHTNADGVCFTDENLHVTDIMIDGKEDIAMNGMTSFEILTHEIGHSALGTLDYDNLCKWESLYKDSLDVYASTGYGFVSNYAHSDIFEDFAESYSAYITNGDYMQLICPAKYEFMRDVVFDGREFAQIFTADGNMIVTTREVAEQLYTELNTEVNGGFDFITGGNGNNINDVYRCFSMIN